MMAQPKAEPLVIDHAIIGSGPAGVSACWPLVEAGREVLLIDAGLSAVSPPPTDRPSLFELRSGAHAEPWQYLVGPALGGVRSVPGLSPKLRTAAGPEFTAEYLSANGLRTEDFSLVGALAKGGLSNVWGAGVSTYDDDDLGHGPVRAHQLLDSYKRVAARIGLSGSPEDAPPIAEGVLLQPPLELAPMAAEILRRARDRRPGARLQFGRARAAALSQNLLERQACSLDGACMWGCAKRAIYCSADELAHLQGKPNFREYAGLVVQRIRRAEHGYRIEGADRRTGQPVVVRARTLILAAGTVPSTRLVLDLLQRYQDELPLQSSPSAALALVVPSTLGRAISRRGTALAQLAIKCAVPGSTDPAQYAFGSLFAAEGMSVADIVAEMPFTRVGGIKFIKSFLSSLMFGLVYLPGEYSDNRLRLASPAAGCDAIMTISGHTRPEAKDAFRRLARLMARELFGCGALLLPGSMRANKPGAEVHYGASLPMGGEFATEYGEIRDAPGLYVVDGAVLPRIAAKHQTFTVMANADRIARKIASNGIQ